jgi:anti-sigma factor RsiW
MTAPSEDLLSAYLDGELDAADRARVEEQLEESAEWRKVLSELGETRELLRGLPVLDMPPGFLDELLAAEPPVLDPSPTAPVSDLAAKRSRRAKIAGWIAAAAAAAAILAVVLIPTQSRVKPAVATFVNTHAARSSVSEEPVSELAPLAARVRLKR